MSELERLLALVPPPAAPVDADVDWTQVEAALGLPLPAGFVELTRRYGRGQFCDEFALLHPEQMIEFNKSDLRDDHLFREDDPEDYPHPLYPEPGGLLVWGNDDSVIGKLCWLTEPADSPERWRSVRWFRRDGGQCEDLDGGVAAVLTGLIEDLLAKQGERVDGPWFEPSREVRDVHVYLGLEEAEGAPPYEERLRILRDRLAPTSGRGGFQGHGVRQDEFAATDNQWRLLYETAYGHQIRVAYPPGDDTRVRAALLPAVEAMGCRVTSVHAVHGNAPWPEIEARRGS
jgi:hypothetical protein